MALYFSTNAPGKLLASLKKAIDDGDVKTWEYDKQGDFTHRTSQWYKKAWLRPTMEQDRLALHILPPRNEAISTEIYGVYHGRFIESIIVHCHDLFLHGVATPKPTSKDVMKGLEL